jgi:YegS/Rv2252/BmrU family lipid kinase
MSKQDEILFLINPISGVGKKNDIPTLIEKHLNSHPFRIAYTEYRNHGAEIAASEKDKVKAIIAIGGDGTVNEIAGALSGSSCALGIIPAGSGNGLARHLKIPLNIKSAIERINQFEPVLMDSGTVNNHFFAGTAGFGFDGYIAHCFDQHHKRGFLSYAALIAREYKKYQPQEYAIEIDGEHIKTTALFCAVANSSQFGNGFTISPSSDMTDGKMELVLVDKFPMIESMIVGTRFFTQSIENSKHYRKISFTNNITIKVLSDENIHFHLDGEPLQDGHQFNINIQPKSLYVI